MANFIQIIPPIIAHRGASLLAPENTVAAFLKAKELGIQWVEFDVRLVATGEIIVFHDDLLDRTTNALGQVIEKSYDYIKTLDAGTWFHSRFKDEKISTLQEILSFLSEQQMSANIEIKTSPGQEEQLVETVFSIMQDFKQLPMLVSSFSLQALRCMRKLSNAIHIGFLMDKWQEDWMHACDELQATAVHVNQRILNQQRVEALKMKNRLLLAYTVNDVQRAKILFAYGVDALFSDCSQQMISFINQNAQK